jgi:tetratricopeptide (TPR) repeat protein
MARQKTAANAIEIDRLATQLAKDPQSKAFLPLAEEYCKVGMWEEAVSVLEEGLKYYPGFITAMVVLGRAYDQLKQPTKARAVLEGAVKLSPENLRAHRTLIKIYVAQGLSQEALNSCSVILAMNPKDEEALAVQASVGIAEPPRETSRVSPKPHPPRKVAYPEPSAASSSKSPSLPLVMDVTAPPEPDAVGDIAPEAAAQLEAPTGVSRCTDMVAKLESWLRSIEQRRRDRPTALVETDP